MKAARPKPETPDQAENAYKAAILEVIKQARFPAGKQDGVLQEISSWLEAYQVFASKPRLSDKKLRKVIDAAEKLQVCISKLDVLTQLQLGNLVHIRPNPLQKIIKEAWSIKNVLPLATHDSDFDSLLIALAVRWKCEFPDRQGITRNGSAAAFGREVFRGPLLDFVQQILDTQTVTYRVLGFKSRAVPRNNRIKAEPASFTTRTKPKDLPLTHRSESISYTSRFALGKRLYGLIKKSKIE